MFRQYHGSRDRESFMEFIDLQKWKTLEPIPAWKSPASFHMGATAYFFKLSQLLRVSCLCLCNFVFFDLPFSNFLNWCSFSGCSQSLDGRLWLANLGLIHNFCSCHNCSWCSAWFGKSFLLRQILFFNHMVSF